MSASADAPAIRPGEVTTTLPGRGDEVVYFIGTIRTPWATRAECPKKGDSAAGPVCRIEIAEPWREALAGVEAGQRLQVLYWMHRARRDLVRQSPGSDGRTTGTFALRSPMRPNPIASSLVDLVGVEGPALLVRGLDCIDGTPVVDVKPERCPHSG